jgi:hypothetical protein
MQAPASEDVHPDEILAHNQEYFEQLFALLAFGNVDRQKVWQIILKLPKNDAIYNELKQLAEREHWKPDDLASYWNRRVDPRSIYKMLYTLRIIADFLPSADDSDVRSRRRRTDSERFAEG